jgi:hypothetical protein
MVFNTTFNHSSVISRQSVLLVEESGENNLSEFTESWGILYMYHSLVVEKIKEFICDNAFISY